jgi:GNAT superfamily N-acetyltransferase
MDAFPCAIEIRHATLAELDDAYALVCEYYEAAGVVERDTEEAFFRDYFCAGAGVWLARSGDYIIGCIALRRLREPHSGEIKRMYVKPEARGRGIAQQLLDTVEAFARASGYRWIYLDTTDQMRAAASLYQRNGYQACPRYNDNPQATIFMRKLLAPSLRP